MEFKAIKEYKNPECPTVEENKSKILMMLVRSRKLSLGVAVMWVLLNCENSSMATVVGFMYNPTDDGDILGLAIRPTYYAILQTICLIGVIVTLIITCILATKNYVGYKECKNVAEKEKMKKRKNRDILIGIGVCLLLIIVKVFFYFFAW